MTIPLMLLAVLSIDRRMDWLAEGAGRERSLQRFSGPGDHHAVDVAGAGEGC